jgi:hypothetical protein
MSRQSYQDTSVPVSRSQEGIRTLLQKHGTRAVNFSEDWGLAQLGFQFVKMKKVPSEKPGETYEIPLIVKMSIPMWKDPKYKLRATANEVAQRERQVWRALYWYIKSQLEAVEFGLRTFEDVFMSDIQMSQDGRTIGDFVRGAIAAGRLALPAEVK